MDHGRRHPEVFHKVLCRLYKIYSHGLEVILETALLARLEFN
jgi:hypothetical protein